MGVNRLVVAAVLLASLVAVTGCDSSKPTESTAKPAAAAKPQSKEPTLYTGEEAMNRMLALARSWAPDAIPARVESDLTAETTGKGGKSALWRGYFASPTRRAVKGFVCSGSRQPDAPPFGVTASPGETGYDAQVAAAIFQPFMMKTDTDKAFEIAQQHGGDVLFKTDAKQPVNYLLMMDPKLKVPLWYVIYGKNLQDRKGMGVINATSGVFVRGGK